MPVPSVPRPAPVASDPQSVSENAVDAALQAHFPNRYGGLEAGPGDWGLVIHVVGPLAPFRVVVDATLATLPQSVPIADVRYVPATTSLAALMARSQLLDGAATSLQSEGVEINGCGPDISNNELLVVVGNLGPKTTSEIEAVVGRSNLELRSGAPLKAITAR